MADGALGDAKLLGGAREALVPRGSIERSQRVQRWQRAAHDCAIIHESNWVKPEKRCFAGATGVLHLPSAVTPPEPVMSILTLRRSFGAITGLRGTGGKSAVGPISRCHRIIARWLARRRTRIAL